MRGKPLLSKHVWSTLKKNKRRIERLEEEPEITIESIEINQTITDFETSLLLKRFSGDPETIREKLDVELSLVKEKLDELDLQEKRVQDEQRWVNWLDHFEKDMESKRGYSDEEKKEFLGGFIERIVVHFDKAQNKHSLEIEFNLPIVHDELVYRNPDRPVEGWTVLEGRKRTINELRVSSGGRPNRDSSH